MAGAPGGLTASIRRKLHEGKTPDEIVQELVAGGLGQVSAQRFVDRALAEDASGAALPSPPPQIPESPATSSNEADPLDQFIREKTAETQAAEAKTGSKGLWASSLLMCSGIVITAGSYLMADAGERYTLMWGPVVFGFALWARAVLGGLAHARSFAWVSAAASISLPIILTVVALGVVAGTEPPPPDDAQAQLVSMLQAKNTSEERYAALEKSYDDELASRRASLDVDKLLAAWDEPAEPNEPGRSRLQCDFALQMASYTGEHRQWLAEQLANRIPASPDGVKICNARAILELDWEAGSRIYAQWAIGDNARLKSAATLAMRRAR